MFAPAYELLLRFSPNDNNIDEVVIANQFCTIKLPVSYNTLENKLIKLFLITIGQLLKFHVV